MKPLSRRPEYTFAYNLQQGRHGWLRLTPAYSAYLVAERLRAYPPTSRLLDPFGGTGTTALIASEYGLDATTTDINPFLVWLSRVKTRRYSPHTLASAEDLGEYLLQVRKQAECLVPQMHDIHRWWSGDALEWLGSVRGAMNTLTGVEEAAIDLLKVAFARCVMAFSQASHHHPSLSFRQTAQMQLGLDDYDDMFRHNLRLVLTSARRNPPCEARVLCEDARTLQALQGEQFSLIITSPPYANRVSYIRELRPYMYWLGYLADTREAGMLDWKAIGGTWGTATSRLREWLPSHELPYPLLHKTADAIRNAHPQNGLLMANYVVKYFEDMQQHICNLTRLLEQGASIHYIVGNSSFYGILVPVEQILAQIFQRHQFREISVRPLRKRNSKRELYEYEITARYAAIE